MPPLPTCRGSLDAFRLQLALTKLKHSDSVPVISLPSDSFLVSGPACLVRQIIALVDTSQLDETGEPALMGVLLRSDRSEQAQLTQPVEGDDVCIGVVDIADEPLLRELDTLSTFASHWLKIRSDKCSVALLNAFLESDQSIWQFFGSFDATQAAPSLELGEQFETDYPGRTPSSS